MKVCFISILDPKDKKSWSGTIHQMYKALSNEFDEEIEVIAPIKVSFFLKALLSFFDKCSRLFFSKGYNKEHSNLLSKCYAKKIQHKVNKLNSDIIFCIGSPVIANLETDIPICYTSDVTFNQIKDYYDNYSNLSEYSIIESNRTESKALNKSNIVVFSSQWAADYASDYYKVDVSKLKVVKFGANADNIPNKNQIEKKYDNTINFLFLGVDWERKGGGIVLDTLQELKNQGYDVHLTICGCTPPFKLNDDNIKVIPFLNKNDKKEYAQFLDILNQTHFLFVPTRADCTPIVFCESNAFGIPVITTDTGGVTSVIKNGVNGITLPLEAKSIDYVNQIKLLLDDKKLIKEMAINARAVYEEELNWDTWGKKMKQILESYIY
jgi:glycosyltransferase involved in cell wall biosynthesis